MAHFTGARPWPTDTHSEPGPSGSPSGTHIASFSSLTFLYCLSVHSLPGVRLSPLLSSPQLTHFVTSQTQWVYFFHPVGWVSLSTTCYHWPEWYCPFWGPDAVPSHPGSLDLSPQVPGCQHLVQSQSECGGSYSLLNPTHAASLYQALPVGSEAMGKVRRVTKGFKIFKWYVVSGWSGLICVICNKCNKSAIYLQLSSKIINFFFQR